jgi:hypothetical protein
VPAGSIVADRMPARRAASGVDSEASHGAFERASQPAQLFRALQ